MEAFKSFIVTNWPTIIEYALMLVAYFLVFLYKSNVSSTKKNIDLAFTQFSTKFADNEANNQIILEKCINDYTTALEECKTQYLLALNESQAKYEAAVNEIAAYKKRTSTLEATLQILLCDDLELEDEFESEVKDNV